MPLLFDLFFKQKKTTHKISIYKKFGITMLTIMVLVGAVGLFIKLSVKKVEAAWFDDTYSYRVKYTFIHNADITSERRVSITLNTQDPIANLRMQSDCDDSRFTDGRGTILRYQLTGTCNSTTTAYSVVIPTTNNGSNVIYFYYGNPTATSGSQDVSGVTLLSPSGGNSSSTEENSLTPVSYWKFDEGAGTSANDSTSGRNTLTLTGTSWDTSDMCISGRCLRYNGTTGDASRIYDAGDIELIPSTLSFSISMWFKHVYAISGSDMLITRVSGTAGSEVGYKVYMNSSGNICFAIDDVAGAFPLDSACTTSSYNNNKWNFLTIVKNGTSSINVYVNGELGAQDTSITSNSISGSTPTIRVGVDLDGTSGYWDGWIDEIKYYPFAKTLDQIKNDIPSRSAIRTNSTNFGSSVASNSYLSQGLVSYLKFEDGSGSTVTDQSGNGNNASLTGSPTWTIGKYGSGLSINAATQTAVISDSSSLDQISNELTVATWIKPNQNYTNPMTDAWYHFANRGSWQFEFGYSGWAEGPSIKVYDNLGGNVTAETAMNLVSGRWYHVAFTVKGHQVVLYVDGKPIATNNSFTGTLNSGGAVNINGDSSHAGNFTQDEFRMYSRALEGYEIQSLYNFGPDPVGYWKLDENSGTSTVSDHSGNSNTGTMHDLTQNNWVPGKFGQALWLQGTANQSVTAADSTSLSITRDMSISTWFKPELTTAATIFPLVTKQTSAVMSYKLVLYGDEIRMYINSTANYVTTNAANLQVGTWYHLQANYDSAAATVSIYINGVPYATTVTGTIPSSITDNTDVLSIGEAPSTGGTVNLQVNSSTDDGDQNSNANDAGRYVPGDASIIENATALAPGSHNNNDEYSAGFRFTNVTVPRGATISAATLTLRSSSGWDPGGINVSYYVSGHDTDDANTITDSPFTQNLSSVRRPRTTEYVVWDQSGTTTDVEESVSLPDVVQEIVDRSGWNSGNDMVIILDTHEDTTLGEWQEYYSYDGNASYAPKLDITYDGHDYYNGYMDDVRIYNYVRSQKQILEDMNGGHPAGGSPVDSYVARWKFDDLTGTTAQDSTLNNNDLTLSTAAWITTGKYGGAWDGDGSRWLSIADDADFDFVASDDFTITGWFNRAATSAAEVILQKFESTGGDGGYRIQMESDGDISFGIDDENTSFPEDSVTSTLATYDDGSWHHFAAVKTGTSSLRLFLDGREVGTADTSISATGTLENNDTLYIGDSNGSNGSDEFGGDLDDIKIYRSALTNNEIIIDMNYNSAASLGGVNDQSEEGFNLPDPILWHKMDDNTGTTSSDSSDNSNDGTITAATWRPGKIGSALYFDIDNVGDINISDNTGLRPTTAITTSAWVNIVNPEFWTGLPIVGKGEPGFATLNYFLYVRHDTGVYIRFGYEDAGAGDHTYSTGDLTSAFEGQWQHVAFTYTYGTASSATMYINGQRVAGSWIGGTGSSATTTSSDNVVIGGDINSEAFSGTIDDVRVYDQALTAAQINYIYSRGAPVVWYKFDECSGATAYNSVLNSNGTAMGLNGTLTPGASGNTTTGSCGSGTSTEMWNNGTTGKFNSSLDFDGTNDYVTTATTSALEFNDSFSIMGWVNPDISTGTSYYTLASKWNGTSRSTQGFQLTVGNGTTTRPQFGLGITTGYNGTTATTALSNSTWYHLAGVYNSTTSTIEIYVNGNRENSSVLGSAMGTNSTDPFRVGATSDTSAQWFSGLIDDVRLYRYPLTAAQIKTVMNGGAVRFGPQTGSP